MRLHSVSAMAVWPVILGGSYPGKPAPKPAPEPVCPMPAAAKKPRPLVAAKAEADE